jgi:hypothetical protein
MLEYTRRTEPIEKPSRLQFAISGVATAAGRQGQYGARRGAVERERWGGRRASTNGLGSVGTDHGLVSGGRQETKATRCSGCPSIVAILCFGTFSRGEMPELHPALLS